MKERRERRKEISAGLSFVVSVVSPGLKKRHNCQEALSFTVAAKSSQHSYHVITEVTESQTESDERSSRGWSIQDERAERGQDGPITGLQYIHYYKSHITRPSNKQNRNLATLLSPTSPISFYLSCLLSYLLLPILSPLLSPRPLCRRTPGQTVRVA